MSTKLPIGSVSGSWPIPAFCWQWCWDLLAKRGAQRGMKQSWTSKVMNSLAHDHWGANGAHGALILSLRENTVSSRLACDCCWEGFFWRSWQWSMVAQRSLSILRNPRRRDDQAYGKLALWSCCSTAASFANIRSHSFGLVSRVWNPPPFSTVVCRGYHRLCELMKTIRSLSRLHLWSAGRPRELFTPAPPRSTLDHFVQLWPLASWTRSLLLSSPMLRWPRKGCHHTWLNFWIRCIWPALISTKAAAFYQTTRVGRIVCMNSTSPLLCWEWKKILMVQSWKTLGRSLVL